LERVFRRIPDGETRDWTSWQIRTVSLPEERSKWPVKDETPVIVVAGGAFERGIAVGRFLPFDDP
jgi:hypothetical protein